MNPDTARKINGERNGDPVVERMMIKKKNWEEGAERSPEKMPNKVLLMPMHHIRPTGTKTKGECKGRGHQLHEVNQSHIND